MTASHPGLSAPSSPDLTLGNSGGRSLSVDQARALILEGLPVVAAIERVAIRQCLGRILAQDVLSDINVPAHDNSAMDGYALNGADLAPDGSGRFRIAGQALAGTPFLGDLQPGDAVRIMTGAVMPPGLDTVVIQEVCDVEVSTLVVPPGQQPGQNRRLAGEDLQIGAPALKRGRQLRPADLGLAASLGLAELPVRRRLRVALFSTGDELRSIGQPLAPGAVYDSNRYTLYGLLQRLGCEIVDLGVVPDTPDALQQTMQTAADCADTVISSGGVSVGEADFTREVMSRLGEVSFWTIAMRPGRPLAYGRIGPAHYFGLPGNPVAVMITFYFLVREALLRQMGAQASAPVPVRVRSASRIRKKPGRTEYQRVRLVPGADGHYEAHLTGGQGSGVLRSMSEAHAIAVIEHDRDTVEPGEWINTLPFEGLD